jgi:Protein of unknown function DUF2617
MNALLERPPVCETALHLFRRSLHPELIESCASRVVGRDDYTLTVHITPQGHTWIWNNGETVLSEVIASRSQDLPRNGHVWKHGFERDCADAFRASSAIVYQMSMQSEMLPPKQFLAIHRELVADGARRGLLYLIESDENATLPPLGFVTADARYGCLVVNAFHTFPSERIILKTQTLIERVPR